MEGSSDDEIRHPSPHYAAQQASADGSEDAIGQETPGAAASKDRPRSLPSGIAAQIGIRTPAGVTRSLDMSYKKGFGDSQRVTLAPSNNTMGVLSNSANLGIAARFSKLMIRLIDAEIASREAVQELARADRSSDSGAGSRAAAAVSDKGGSVSRGRQAKANSEGEAPGPGLLPSPAELVDMIPEPLRSRVRAVREQVLSTAGLPDLRRLKAASVEHSKVLHAQARRLSAGTGQQHQGGQGGCQNPEDAVPSLTIRPDMNVAVMMSPIVAAHVAVATGQVEDQVQPGQVHSAGHPFGWQARVMLGEHGPAQQCSASGTSTDPDGGSRASIGIGSECCGPEDEHKGGQSSCAAHVRRMAGPMFPADGMGGVPFTTGMPGVHGRVSEMGMGMGGGGCGRTGPASVRSDGPGGLAASAFGMGAGGGAESLSIAESVYGGQRADEDEDEDEEDGMAAGATNAWAPAPAIGGSSPMDGGLRSAGVFDVSSVGEAR